MDHSAIKVDRWTIRPDINRIESEKGTQNVGPRVMDLLLELIKKPGQVHSREDLLRTVWGDVIVNEESLTKSISFLRQYFNDDDEVIETIRSVGYRWIGPRPEYVALNGNAYTPKKTKVKSRSAFKVAASASVILVVGAIVYFTSSFKSEKPSPVNITHNKVQERVPRISPDGKSILFAKNTPTGGGMDVYIQEIKSGETKRITTSMTLETDPVWSPDGKKVAFYKNNGEDVSIEEIDLETGDQRRLAIVQEIPNLSAISWSPNGEVVAFCDRPGFNDLWSIYLVNNETLEVERMTFPQACAYGDVSPRFSPDGNKIAFIRIDRSGLLYKHLIPGIGDAYVLDLDTKETRMVSKSDFEISGIEWLDDSDNLAMLKVDNFFTFDLMTVNLKTDQVKKLYSTDKMLRNLSKTPKQDEFVFEEWTERFSIWKANIKDDGRLEYYRAFMDVADKSWHPQVSHNSEQLAYISTKSGHSQIWLHNLKEKTDQQLTSFKTEFVRNPRWSPDDSKILFEVFEKSNFNIYSVDVLNGSISDVATSERQERNAVWSPDGNSIYLALEQNGRFDIFKKYIETGDLEQVTFDGAFAVRVTNQGVFYLKYIDGDIYKIDEGGYHSVVVNDINPLDWFNWEVIDGHMYYVKRYNGFVPHLYRQNLATSEQIDMSYTNLNFSHVYQGFSIDANSGVVYATVHDFQQSDIMMLAGL
ncbi:MAG: winged helix-turn-helix domain-containing protein [Cyclobacteriaceae bacterium]